jgi:hypothetical protein
MMFLGIFFGPLNSIALIIALIHSMKVIVTMGLGNETLPTIGVHVAEKEAVETDHRGRQAAGRSPAQAGRQSRV